MFSIFLIGLGGFCGAILRYLVGIGVHNFIGHHKFPYGIMCANIIGCFSIGFLDGMIKGKNIFPSEIESMIFIGILGGFTTFSSFGYDSIKLIEEGQFFSAFLNISLTVFFGLMAVWLGLILSRKIF